MQHHERVTFNQAGEIFEHAVVYLKRMRDALDAQKDGDLSQRVTMLLDTFATEQRNLLGAVERYVEDADDRLLNTFSQYSIELPSDPGQPESPLTTLTLTTWLQKQNQYLAATFRELAETAKSADLRAAFAALRDQVEGHERKLSKEYQRFEDL